MGFSSDECVHVRDERVPFHRGTCGSWLVDHVDKLGAKLDWWDREVKAMIACTIKIDIYEICFESAATTLCMCLVFIVFLFVSVRVCVCMHTNMNACMHACVCVCLRVCVCVCVCVRVDPCVVIMSMVCFRTKMAAKKGVRS